MTDSNHVLCPECGWTGTRDELVEDENEYSCPICANVVEIVD